MREAHVILPHNDNLGASLDYEQLDFAESLEAAFGSYTWQTTTVNGVWTDETTGLVYRDQSTEYRIARDWDAKSLNRLERLIGVACKAMRQECVYYKTPDGEVYLVSPSQGMESPKWAEAQEA